MSNPFETEQHDDYDPDEDQLDDSENPDPKDINVRTEEDDELDAAP